MFSKKSKNNNQVAAANAAAAPAGTSNHIVHGTTLEGHVESKSDIRIDGTLNGTLKCEGRVIIGESGFINGEVNCQNALVEGKFVGTLAVVELLSVKESADVQGDINSGRLHIQQGAIFNVKCSTGGQTIGSLEGQEA